MTLEAKYTIQVLAALINNTTTPMPPAQIDWKAFFDFALKHKVENMMYAALLGMESIVPNEIMTALAQRYSLGIAHEAAQEVSFQELMDKFEKKNIKSIPLKGCILKHLYPMPDYRQSSDIDILIAQEDFHKIAPVMEELAYKEAEDDEFEIHIAYRRPPHVLIEIHKKLVEKNNRTSEYLSDIWKHVLPSDGYSCRFEMDKETTYVYIVAHMAKHIKNGGAGIRLVLDIWVLLKLWENEFDKEKLDEALRAANLYEFNEWAAALARMWFGDQDCEDKNVHILGEYVVDSGIYGNKENGKKIASSAATDGGAAGISYKIRKFCKGVFLPVYAMRGDYPMLNKYKFLLPIMWVHRVFKMLLEGREAVSKRLITSLEIKDDAKELKEIWESVR